MRLPAARPLLRVLAAGALAALVLVGAAYGYFRIFSQFAPYDDEGYVMQSVRSFVEGHRLYDDVFTQYGPAFYLLQRVIHGVLRVPLTHDVVRLTTLLLWLATAVAAAGIVIRLTRSLALGAMTFVPVLVHLVPLINEPGHPQTLLGLTVALTCLVVASDRGEISTRHAACCGALVAFTALAKINVGTYLFLGVAIPLLLAGPLPRVAGPLLIALAAAVPLLVLRQHLGDQSGSYGVIGAMSAAAVTLTCWRLLRPPALSWRTLGAFALAFAATGGAIVIVIVALGTSPRGLMQGILIQPARLSDLFYMPVAIPRTAATVALSALPLAALLTWRRVLDSPSWPAIAFVCKASLGIGTLYAFQVGYVELMAYVTPFVWIVLLPTTGTETARTRIGRGVLAGVAAFELLQAYPVGGSQVPFATFSLIPAALVCLGDAIAVVAASAPWTFPRSMIGLQAIAVVWAMHAFTPLLGKDVLHHYYAVYMGSQGLRLPGAARLRLSPDEVARFQWLSGTLARQCSSFVALPGFQSLHPWTGLAPLTTKNAGTWMTLLSPAEQADLWKTVDARGTPCAILQRQVALNWIGGQPIESLPAYHELLARFEPVAVVDGYELLVRRDASRVATAPPMSLIAGRLTFAPRQSAVRVVARFVQPHPDATIRAWIRSTQSGVVLACQSAAQQHVPSVQSLPILYVGTSGRLHGQYAGATSTVLTSAQPIADDRWHHVVLVRTSAGQTLYVDGARDDASDGVQNSSLPYCQVGIGLTAGWPDASAGWTTFLGSVEGLAVEPRAWTAEEVARDRATSLPRP